MNILRDGYAIATATSVQKTLEAAHCQPKPELILYSATAWAWR